MYMMRLLKQLSVLLPSQSVDLVTVAQAIHWFDFDSFYTEVKRVLKANGVIAVIGYGLIQAEQTELNELLQQLYFETLEGIIGMQNVAILMKAIKRFLFRFMNIQRRH